jgi:hypothetical protein
VVANNLVAFNSSGITSDTGRSALSSNDVHGNAAGDYNNAGVPDPTGRNGNISKDPLFVDAPGGDYHPRLGSPVIDAGDDAFVSATADLDGLPRVQGDHVDMGAFEGRPIPAATLGQAVSALRIAGGLTAATGPEAQAFTDDGRMDLVDALKLLRRANGL